MNKTDRAVQIHRSMTPHQMALRIVELEDIAEIVGQSASERSKRITELQDALELAEEAVRAKHFPDSAKMVIPDGWQLVPVEPTIEMSLLPRTARWVLELAQHTAPCSSPRRSWEVSDDQIQRSNPRSHPH